MNDHVLDDTPQGVHHPVPLTLPAPPLVAHQPHALPEVQTVQLPDGRLITGYALTPAKPPEPHRERIGVNPAAMNIALAGLGFAAACGGLFLLTMFITALAALVQQLVLLAAVIFGGFIAVQGLGTRPERGHARTTVNIRRAVIKRNHFHH
ncbi:hypothetical protein [Streptomyces antimicrobicus]|uniref:Integral membrane protein n=1 Tax=Streptomyces antimicrobicus TaxID=2883108 RepID=A0ABS8AZM3_9ACTN|nr:hypothetical protein [Streptomyces antimicrobicus]MCB5177801.1 hypothetical protein [Streptomyces antimicrobicus]